MLNWGHFCTSWNIFVNKMKILKKDIKYWKSFRLWFYGENFVRNWTRFDISCKFQKIWKTLWCVNLYIMKHFLVKKWKFWKKLKILKVRSDCDSALKILLETGLNLKFHANLKKYEKLHDVSICTSWNICVS